MVRRDILVIIMVILVSSLELTTLTKTLAEALAVLNISVVAAYLIISRSELIIPNDIGLAILFIWGIYVGHLIISAVLDSVLIYSLIRVPAFLFFFVVFMFVIPQSTSPNAFFYILSRFGTFLTLVGLSVLVIGEFAVGPLQLSPYHSTVPVLPFLNEPRVHAIQAPFTNPNQISFVCSLGLVASITEWDRTRSLPTILFVGLNGIGLQLAGSRAAQLGALVALAIYAAYRIVGPKLAVTTFFGAVVGILTLIGVQFDVLPPLPVFTDISLNNRETLWKGVFRAVSASPFFGLGLVPSAPAIQPYVTRNAGIHSGFLYQILSSGLVGFTAYSYIYARTLFSGLATATSRKSMAIYVIAIVPLIGQIFQTYSLFGATMLPAVTALSLGFAMNEFITAGGGASTETRATQANQPLGKAVE